MFLKRFLLSWRTRKDLDQVLSSAPGAEASLREKTHWFFDLLEWIRHRGVVQGHLDFKTGTPQSLRVKHILNVLDRQPDWKKSVAVTLYSVFSETSAFQLFVQTGLAVQDSFTAEFMDRLQRKILPVPPDETNLTYLFQQNFHNETDLQWVQQIDAPTFVRIQNLIRSGAPTNQENLGRFKEEAEKAILLLSVQVQALGVSAQIRQRSLQSDFRKSSFYLFSQYLQKYFSETDNDLKAVLASQFSKKIGTCYRDLSEIKQQLNEFGVSVQIVFLIDKLESLLRRIENLMLISESKEIDPIVLSTFLETLIAESLDKKSLTSLIGESFSLLARKIVERTGETGEDYITRDRQQQRDMFRRAIGGGVLTTMTTFVKFGTSFVGFSSFFAGVAYGINYAASFLTIHFMHFTLATKQSSMTAPALASRMQSMDTPEAFDRVIKEIINLLRTQVTAVFGNILGVVPITIAICLLFEWATGQSFLSEEKAFQVFQDFSIFGPTMLFAAFTGVLLWMSSLIAGWFDNWFAYHRLGQALAQNRRLRFVIGDVQARKLAHFLRKNMAGIMGNISLGFLLGLSPAIIQFFGLYLDVRHVTLSSGALSVAAVSLPLASLDWFDWTTAILGIISMAVLNLSVSFSLAFAVAVRARKIQAPQRKLIYIAVWRKFTQQPLSLVFASKEDESQTVAGR